MATNYDLNNTGEEVQERLDQVFPNADDIAAEAQERAQADTVLDNKISQEAATRSYLVNQLRSEISAEAEAREQAIESLHTEVTGEISDAVANEASERQQADESLSANITAEADAREQAIESLHTEVTGEISDAVSIETVAREQADSELRSALEGDITTAIEGEQEAREQSEEALSETLKSYTDQAVHGAFDGSIGRVWEVIGQIIGEDVQGINMEVEPTTFKGEEVELNISADSAGGTGIFERIAFYANDVLIHEYENVASVNLTTVVSGRTTIKCVARINGETYTKEQTVNRMTEFYIGGGAQASDVMTEECRRDIQEGMAGEYAVELAEGDSIVIVMDISYEQAFQRADMNGFEIPFDATYETIDDTEYYVLVSTNVYKEGIYSIFVNR